MAMDLGCAEDAILANTVNDRSVYNHAISDVETDVKVGFIMIGVQFKDIIDFRLTHQVHLMLYPHFYNHAIFFF